jgi:predicted nucleic-acid-binding Zn-ribbon protein
MRMSDREFDRAEMEEFKVFKYCPYCGSTNIEEEEVDYYYDVWGYAPKDHVVGKCKDCGEGWRE